MTSDLTIVMYHYVRDLNRTRYPAIRGRQTTEFRFQVKHFLREYTPVSMAEVVHCVRTGDQLPRNAILLTFDDGYIDHYVTCFPILLDAGISGAFFPPVDPVKHAKLLDVNRVHFMLAVADPAQLGAEIDEAINTNASEYGLQSPEAYRSKYAKPNRFDGAEAIYVKRMLQVALPEIVRNAIARTLFARHVSHDEAAFASELYCTTDQLRLMQKSGMYIGSHGVSHYWLDSISLDQQRLEVEGSISFLREVGSPADDYWVMCYPYGAWNDSLLSVLQESRCALGLTTTVAKARIGIDSPLLLPRLDTNDLPTN